jgi:hypothetical protein
MKGEINISATQNRVLFLSRLPRWMFWGLLLFVVLPFLPVQLLQEFYQALFLQVLSAFLLLLFLLNLALNVNRNKVVKIRMTAERMILEDGKGQLLCSNSKSVLYLENPQAKKGLRLVYFNKSGKPKVLQLSFDKPKDQSLFVHWFEANPLQ